MLAYIASQATMNSYLGWAGCGCSPRGLVERVLLALEGGEATGTDRDGTNSGTIYIMDAEEYPLWNVRVDDEQAPQCGFANWSTRSLNT